MNNVIKEELNFSLEELKTNFQIPRLYLANYFANLKAEVDHFFIQKTFTNNNFDFLEIIQKIEYFEKNCFKNTPNNKYSNEKFASATKINIEKIQNQINSLVNSYDYDKEITQIKNLIDKINNSIEKVLFANKTIIFLKNYGWEKKTFLLIIHDENFNKNSLINKNSTELSSENLKIIILKQKLSKLASYILELSLDLHNVFELYLADSQIASIEKFTFSQLKKNLAKIDLRRNHLKTINLNSFNDLVNLKELILSHNKINLIEDNSFKDLFNLIKLDLSGNEIKKINLNSFSGLKSIQFINLEGNLIDSIEDSSFESLSYLISLDLNYNQLLIINLNTFKGLYNLKELNLSNNRLKCIQNDSFIDLSNLSKLNLQSNFITQVNLKTFHGLFNLKDLRLSKNKINSIEKNSFKYLVNLEIFHLFQNDLIEGEDQDFNDGLPNLKEYFS